MLSPRRNSIFSPYSDKSPVKKNKQSVIKSSVQFPLKVYNFVDTQQENDDYRHYLDPQSPILFNHIYDLGSRPRTASYARVRGTNPHLEYQHAMSTYATIKAAVNNTLTDTFLNNDFIAEVPDDDTEGSFLLTELKSYKSPQYSEYRNIAAKSASPRRQTDYSHVQPSAVKIDNLIDRNLPSPVRAARNRPLRSQLSTALKKQPIKNQPVGFTIEFSEKEIKFPNENIQYVPKRPRSSRYPVLLSWGK